MEYNDLKPRILTMSHPSERTGAPAEPVTVAAGAAMVFANGVAGAADAPFDPYPHPSVSAFDDVAHLQRVNSDLDFQVDQLRRTNQNLRDQIAILEGRAAVLEARAAAFACTLTTPATLLENENQGLRNKIAKLKDENSALCNANKELRNTIAAQYFELKGLREIISTGKAANARQADEIAELCRRLTAMREDREAVDRARSAEHDAHAAGHSAKVAALEAQLADAEAQAAGSDRVSAVLVRALEDAQRNTR